MVKKECKKVEKVNRLPLHPRYLPGEIYEDLIKTDLKSYKIHLLQCANAKPVVDNKAPKLDVNVYYNVIRLNEDARKAKINYVQNFDLLKKLNIINRMGGKVDCWNFGQKKRKSDELEKKLDLQQFMAQNKKLFNTVNSLSSEYSPEIMAKEWKVLKEIIISKSRYPWFQNLTKCQSISDNATASLSKNTILRTKCFFDLEIEQSKLPLGRIIFELYNDYVPSICANFEAFCKGYKGLSYKGTPFHRILSGYWCQGGDVTNFNGVGGASIYYEPIPDENFTLQHTCPGVLSTYNEDKNISDSKFNLTFRPLRTMDGKKVVFGKVVKGLQNLQKIEAYGTKFGKPLQRIIVSRCGVFKQKNIHL